MLRGARVGTYANVVHSKFVIQKMLTPAETRVSSTCLALESRHISVPLSVFKQRVVHKARITETCKGDTLFPRARAGGPMEHKNLLVLNTK